MDMSDEAMTASCLEWSTGQFSVISAGFNPQCSVAISSDFKQVCGVLYVARGHAALAASNYDEAIELYSGAIDLDSVTDTIFANRCKAKLGKMLWEAALIDAQKVRCHRLFHR